MTNVMREKPLEGIRKNARAFVEKCLECCGTSVTSSLCNSFRLSMMEAAAECKDHMAAGIDTTGDGLCSLMWELSQPHNHGIQERLHQELSQAPPGISLDDLPYLEAVLKEALRLAPPIPMSLRDVPSGGWTIGGYYVLEGTIVSCQPYSVHRLNKDVFPRPDTFWPEKWN
ncbi:hypothetical protein VTN00DRAFT_9816 [Thermoascus crustaceus]|uniref:uncharacterized protein n=1 Tax=Thermoascus crustaceus TaxID=5088 RepID=UPI0037422A94